MKAELHAAFVWDCDSCGAENFERSVEIHTEDIAQVAKDAVVTLVAAGWEKDDTEQEAKYLTRRMCFLPEQVSCHRCGTLFETEAHIRQW